MNATASAIARLGWVGALALVTAGLIAAAALWVPHFATSFNISQAAAGISERALLTLPMVLLIIGREIDLSVASTLALCSVVLGVLVQAGWPLGAAIVAVLCVGAVAGSLNGALVTALGLPSLVVTLGTLALFRGIGYVLLGTGSVNVLPDVLTNFGIDNVAGTPVPWTLVPFLVLAPLFAILLQRTPIGRQIYALGGNPAAALYSGVRVRRLRFALFVASGVVCAIAGIVFTARLSNARANNALGMELDVITVALLGGVSVFGGRGKLTGVLCALVLVAVLRNVLGLVRIGGDAQGTVIGMLLIGSLLVGNTAQALLGRMTKAQTPAATQQTTNPEEAT